MSLRKQGSVKRGTLLLSIATMASKLVGLLREIFLARYLGVGAVADAFFIAFWLPNSLRKIFAEGALSAAFVPTIVSVVKQEGKEEASRLMFLMMLVMQSVLFLLSTTIAFFAYYVVLVLTPGWVNDPLALQVASGLLSILIYFITFMSASSLCAGALQAIHHFLIPAWAQIVMNCLFVMQLYCAHLYAWPVTMIAWCLVGNGAIFFLMHVGMYYYKGFAFLMPSAKTWKPAKQVLKKMIPCLVGMGAVELNSWADQMLASYLPEGSISLLRYTYGFLRIPIGVFGVAFSTILLPLLSRLHVSAPRRMSFIFLEAAKTVAWVVIPMSLFLGIFARPIFATTLGFFSRAFTVADVNQAALLLLIFSTALFFMTFEKIILNIFYASHVTSIPTVVTLAATFLNFLLNIVGIWLWGLPGIVLATVISMVVKCFAFLFLLKYKLSFTLYLTAFGRFLWCYFLQLGCAVAGVSLGYRGAIKLIALFDDSYQYFLLDTLLYWCWVGPLCGVGILFIYLTRRYFGIKLYFLR